MRGNEEEAENGKMPLPKRHEIVYRAIVNDFSALVKGFLVCYIKPGQPHQVAPTRYLANI